MELFRAQSQTEEDGTGDTDDKRFFLCYAHSNATSHRAISGTEASGALAISHPATTRGKTLLKVEPIPATDAISTYLKTRETVYH